MKSHLAKIVDFIALLDDDLKAALNGVTTRKKFGKAEFLLRPDEVCRCGFFIEKGIARKFYTTEDGRDITTELYFADDLAV